MEGIFVDSMGFVIIIGSRSKLRNDGSDILN